MPRTDATPRANPFPPHVAAVLADADRAVQALAGGSHHRLYQTLRQSADRLAPADAFYVGFYREGRRVSFPYSFDGREYDDPAAIPYGEEGLSAWMLLHRRPYWSREDGGQLLWRGQMFGDTDRPSEDVIVAPVFETPVFEAPGVGTSGPDAPRSDGAEVLGMMSMQSYAPGAYDAITVRAFAWLAGSLATVLAREREDEHRRSGLGSGAVPRSQAVADEVAARLGALRREVDTVGRLVPADAPELSQAVAGLKRLALVSGVGRLYVHAADTKRPVELARYLWGLAPEDYRLVGTGPVRLVVAFPRPRLSVLARETEAERGQRWVKALTELPVRGAVLRLATGRTGTMQVAEVADPGALPGFDVPGFERFLSASVAGSGQSAREAERAQAWRRDEVERVAGGNAREPQAKGPALASSLLSRTSTPKTVSRTRPLPILPEPHGTEGERFSSTLVPGPSTHGTAIDQETTIAEDGSLA